MKKIIPVELVRKYLSGNSSAHETRMVNEWFDSYSSADFEFLSPAEKSKLEEILFVRLMDNISKEEALINTGSNITGAQLQEDNTPFKEVNMAGNTFTLWKKMAVAASIIICLGFAGYFLFRISHNKPAAVVATRVKPKLKDIPPGGKNALLTLANGSSIVLNNVRNGLITRQGNIAVTKTKDGQLVYKINNGASNTEPVDINTISTPKGGQYQIVLPDGTKVWLNALSFLKFPTNFKGKTREVEMSGEAYFEVAKNPSMPFIVKSAKEEIMVLGTHFNVNDYDDEKFSKTTLLEGSVKITGKKSAGVLKPGDQAVLNNNEEIEITKDADLEEAVAWKNGIFEFNASDVTTIMRQASRWYDINVIYKGTAPHTLYKGKISRNVNISELLNMIQYMGVNYTMEGNNITITN